MAITKIQQTQISGSLSFNDGLAAGSGLAGKSTLVADLDGLRSQINRIIGATNWYDALQGSQDLADIYAAMHASGADAAFQGRVYAAGDAGLSGSLAVAQLATFANGATVNGAALDVNADLTANKISIDGDTATRLYIVDTDGSIKDESKLTFDGSKLVVDGALDLKSNAVVSGTFTSVGAASLQSTLGVSQLATFSMGATVNGAALDVNADLTANKISIDGDTAGRLYMVGSDGAIKDEGNLFFDGALLSVTGSLAVSSNASVGGGLSVTGDITGAADLAIMGDAEIMLDLGVSGGAQVGGALAVTGSAHMLSAVRVDGILDVNSSMYVDAAAGISGSLTVGGVADFNGDVTANKISIDGDTAGRLYIVGASGEIADESSLTWSGTKLTVAGAADLQGIVDADGLYVSGPTGLSGSVVMAGGLTVNTAAADFNAGITANEIKIDGDVAGRLYIVGASGEIADESSLAWASSKLTVAGAADIQGVVDADVLYVSGQTGLSGSVVMAGGLTVNTVVADFNAGITANEIKIDGDTAQRLYIVDADGSIKDEAKLTFDGSELWVNGDLEVVGGDITMSNSMSISSATAGKLLLTSDLVEASGDLKVAGNDISGSAGLNITLESGGDVKIAGDLQLMGNELKSSAGNVVLQLSGDDAIFKGDVSVDGDLTVKGAMTYIETTNLKVQDAFIHLATGSTGTQSSGLVLHGGAGASADLMLAQDGGAGEFVFARLLHSSQDHSDVDGDNSVVVDAASLVPAWMSSVKIGAAEGSLSGSLAVAAEGVTLSSAAGKDLSVSAAADLLFSANGNAAISFADAAQVPDASFVATTVVGMLNELRIDLDAANSGGNLSKDVYGVADFSGNDLDFSGQGTLSSADHKLVDVFLNGVLMAPGHDLTAVATDKVTFASSIVSTLMADDVITVVIRG